MAALSARDGARNAVVLAQLMGLREHGVRLQNLVIDAEYRLVELLPPKPESTEGGPWGQPLKKLEGAP